MSIAVSRKTRVVCQLLLGLAALALSLTVAPLSANASLLESASLASQEQPANTTLNGAQLLKSGVTATGSFTQDAEFGDLEAYWFKAKTSARNSAYSLRLDSLSGNAVRVTCYDVDGDENEGWFAAPMYYVVHGQDSLTTTRTTGYKTEGVDRSSYYYFQVSQATDSDFPSKQGDGFALTFTEHPIIKKVTGLSAFARAKTSLTMKWTKQSNATKYQVRYKPKGGSWKTVSVSKNSAKISKLKTKTSYRVKVRAYRKGGWSSDVGKVSNWSPWSAVKSVKTKG